MFIYMEELKINIFRFEYDKQIWEFKVQIEVQFQQKVCDILQGENKEFLFQLEEICYLYYSFQNELVKLELEFKSFKDQLIDLSNFLEKCKE